MEGRAFLDVAEDLANGPGEPHWRTAAGRAYYALLLECRSAQQRWGLSAVPQGQTHRLVRLRFVVARDPDLLRVAIQLEKLSAARITADYRPEDTTTFTNAVIAINHIGSARAALALLDQIDADPARRTAAAGEMGKVYP